MKHSQNWEFSEIQDKIIGYYTSKDTKTYRTEFEIEEWLREYSPKKFKNVDYNKIKQIINSVNKKK